MQRAEELFKEGEAYSLSDAIKLAAQFPKVKFDETLELHFHLNINPKSTDQVVRGTAILPHGTGKQVRILVFAEGEQADAAKNAGAHHVGLEDLIEKINLAIDFS